MTFVSHPSPLTPARRRAQELAASGDLAGARAILEKAVDLGRANLGEDDPDVLQTSLQLGRLLQRTDDHPGARRVLEEAYAAGQWRLGDHDPLMVEISHDIGLVAEELGNRHEARKAFTRVAEHGPAALGANHEAVGRARAYLGLDPDSVRATPPPTAPPAEPAPSPGAPLTLITPVPAEHPFRESPNVPYTVEPPPPPSAQTVWTPPEPRRAAEPLEEPTVVHPTITPRPSVSPQPPDSAPVTPPGWSSRSTQPDTSPPLTRPDSSPSFEQPDSSPSFEQPDSSASPTVEFGRSDRSSTPTVEFDRPDRASSPTVEFGRPAPLTDRPRPGQQWTAPPSSGALQPAARHFPVPAAHPPQRFADAPTSALPPVPANLPVPVAGPTPYRKRGLTLFAVITAALASLIAVVALVFVLANRKTETPPPAAPTAPTLAGTPPGNLELVDKGSEVDVSWTDPAHGTVPFIVLLGRPGEELTAVAHPPPGTTSLREFGLNARLNYCFAVVAAYGTNQFASSPQRCTNRPAANTTPSKK